VSTGVTGVIPTIPAVTVVIPYHEERKRNGMLDRAIASVEAQTARPGSLLLEPDLNREGSATTRNRALSKIATEWVLWLDSDDQLTPHAVQLLTEAQQETGADVVSGAAWIPQRPDHSEPGPPVPPGRLDPGFVTARSVLHVSSLVRVSLARECGGFEFRRDPASGMMLDDFGFYSKLAEAGASFWRIPETVLIWHVHGANTSGKPDRW
jgi:hypothetical protein